MKINSEPIYQYVLLKDKIEIIKYSSVYVGDIRNNNVDEYKIYGKTIFGIISSEIGRLAVDELYISKDMLNKRFNKYFAMYNIMFSFEKNNEILFINETIKFIEGVNRALVYHINSNNEFLKSLEKSNTSAMALAGAKRIKNRNSDEISRLTRNNSFIDYLIKLRSKYENKEEKINGCN